MANARQKKKKNAAASKQAATAYKGKNAPIKPATVKKPQEISAPPKVEAPKAETEKAELKKVELPKAEFTEPEKKVPPKTESQKNDSKKAETKKPEKKSAPKNTAPKKTSKSKPAKKNNKKTEKDSSKSKRKALSITKISAVVLAISVVIASVCVLMWVKDKEESKEIPPEAIPKYNGINISDEIALIVTEDLANQEEFANGMQREGDTDAFLYYASDSLFFDEKNSQASLNLVNVSSNKCVFIASIVDEAGNVCFSSRGLLPGRMLADIGINNQSYGKHEMMLVVAGYDPNTYELIGVQSSDLTVQVGIEEETAYAQKN